MNEKSMNNSLESDWERVDAMSDEEIDTSEIPPLSQEFFKKAKVRMPKQEVTINIDEDLIKWFQSQGKDYEHKINAALRIYVESHNSV